MCEPLLPFTSIKMKKILNLNYEWDQVSKNTFLIDGGHQEPIVTSGINVKTLARLNETCGTTEKVFYSKDVPVLMAIYYSTKRYETFK